MTVLSDGVHHADLKRQVISSTEWASARVNHAPMSRTSSIHTEWPMG